MLNFEDLKEYFEKFFIDYAPYRSNKVYSTIIDNLLKSYFDSSYNEIPSVFKSAFENQQIPIEFYDNILLSVGFNHEILNKISYKDKEILLKSFTDFNKYKGTLNQIQKIASDFEEEINLYELLIDFRTVFIPYYNVTFYKGMDYIIVENEFIYDNLRINDYINIPDDPNSYRLIIKKDEEFNKIYIDRPFEIDSDIESITIKNINVKRWVFVPDLIYSGEKVKNQVLNKFLDYESIYNETKKYFISIEYLEANKNDLILPIKSNLIFLDYKKFREINTLNHLISTILLKEYRKSRLVLYFKDGNYLTDLERIYKLWYYVIFRFYNKGITTNGLPNPKLIFSIDSPYLNLKPEHIPTILSEYNNIQTQHEASLFYKKYISDKFSPLTNYGEDITIEQFKLLIENEIGLDLFNYVEDRIFTAQGIDSNFECDFILDEIRSSILTWAYSNSIDHIDYLLNSLSYISTSIDLSPTYNLILFLKPYHVELIKESNEILEINEKFDLMNPYHKYKFMVEYFRVSILNISHRILNSTITMTPNDNVNIVSTVKNTIIYTAKAVIDLINKYLQIITYVEESVEFQSHKDLYDIKAVMHSFIFCISNVLFNIIKLNKSSYDINHIFTLDDREKRIIAKLYYDISHIVTNSITMQDADSSGRNILDLIDLEIIAKYISEFEIFDDFKFILSLPDLDSSGRNILDLFDLELISSYKSVSIIPEHSVNFNVETPPPPPEVITANIQSVEFERVITNNELILTSKPYFYIYTEEFSLLTSEAVSGKTISTIHDNFEHRGFSILEGTINSVKIYYDIPEESFEHKGFSILEGTLDGNPVIEYEYNEETFESKGFSIISIEIN
jgi:hypothetical protein